MVTGAQKELAAWTGEDFAPCQGQTFIFESTQPSDGAPRRARMELIEVSSRRRRPAEQANRSAMLFRTPFSLLFRNLENEPLDGGPQRLSLDGLAPADLLLTRVLVPYLDPNQMYYEAVFG